MLCRRCPTYKICVPTAGCCQPPNPVGQALPAHPSHTRFGLIQVAENLRAAQSKRLPYSHHLAPLFRTIIPWYTWYILWAALFYVRYSYSHVRGFVKHFCCTAVRNVSPFLSSCFFSFLLWVFLSGRSFHLRSRVVAGFFFYVIASFHMVPSTAISWAYVLSLYSVRFGFGLRFHFVARLDFVVFLFVRGTLAFHLPTYSSTSIRLR